jgi:dTDP-4-dehydrorhamnose 3,5-epimerase
MSHRPRNIFRLLKDNTKVFTDSRGDMEVLFEESDAIVKRSRSVANVFRGLHYQDVYSPQMKLVRVISGKIIDFAVDVFMNRVQYRTLTPDSGWVVIGVGLAHGFYTVEASEVEYVCYGAYSADHEHTYSITEFLRDEMNIREPIISEKDRAGKELKITSWENLDKDTLE